MILDGTIVIEYPASTWIHCPVTPEDKGLASQVVQPATSDCVTFLRRGELFATWSRMLSNPGIPLAAIVLIGPLEIAFTRCPSGPKWQANSLVQHSNAAFAILMIPYEGTCLVDAA